MLEWRLLNLPLRLLSDNLERTVAEFVRYNILLGRPVVARVWFLVTLSDRCLRHLQPPFRRTDDED